MKSQFETIVADHRRALESTFAPEQVALLERISREILKAFKAGRKVLLCGNGGSAADAQHIAAEFVGRFKRERRSLPAVALTTDTSILTAVANDYDYERVFARQVEGLAVAGDVLVAISTSGNSKNVLEAVKTAKAQGVLTIGFTGESGGLLRGAADLCFRAGSKKTPHIQEMHITALHAVSEVVENVLFGH